MSEQQQSLQELQHIKKMMERSSRFISLSGLSGVAAGVCALLGAWLAYDYVVGKKDIFIDQKLGLVQAAANDYGIIFNTWLFWIAAATFISALISAFIFTWIKSKKQGVPVWGNVAMRLAINVSIPIIAGGIFLFKLIHFGTFGLVAPGCLIFYGLALINAGKYTLGEIRWLGFCQLLLGIISLGFVGYGIYFWAAGFGVLHIIYGILMWVRYERKEA